MQFRVFFLYYAVLEMFSSERAPKMLKNEVLDVQKLADTAENEPLQVPEIWKTLGLWVHYGCSAHWCSAHWSTAHWSTAH